MKKFLWIIWFVMLLFLLLLLFPYSRNEQMIKKYERGIMREDLLPKFSLTQPYVLPYNKGNIAFGNELYDKAAECYKKALKTRHPKGKDCKIRINLALAMVTPLMEQTATEKNRDEIIAKLREAVDVLTEKGCASEEGFWHDYQAQKLMREILAYIEQLENGTSDENDAIEESGEGAKEQDGMPAGDEGKEPSAGGNEEEPKNGEAQQKAQRELEDALRESFDAMQQEGTIERGRRLDSYRSDNEISFGAEKNW